MHKGREIYGFGECTRKCNECRATHTERKSAHVVTHDTEYRSWQGTKGAAPASAATGARGTGQGQGGGKVDGGGVSVGSGRVGSILLWMGKNCGGIGGE